MKKITLPQKKATWALVCKWFNYKIKRCTVPLVPTDNACGIISQGAKCKRVGNDYKISVGFGCYPSDNPLHFSQCSPTPDRPPTLAGYYRTYQQAVSHCLPYSIVPFVPADHRNWVTYLWELAKSYTGMWPAVRCSNTGYIMTGYNKTCGSRKQ